MSCLTCFPRGEMAADTGRCSSHRRLAKRRLMPSPRFSHQAPHWLPRIRRPSHSILDELQGCGQRSRVLLPQTVIIRLRHLHATDSAFRTKSQKPPGRRKLADHRSLPSPTDLYHSPDPGSLHAESAQGTEQPTSISKSYDAWAAGAATGCSLHLFRHGLVFILLPELFVRTCQPHANHTYFLKRRAR
jgi:hypothetical protein